jgi:antitoxin FitA
MADLLVRNLKPQLKRRIAESARKNGNSLSEEAKVLIERGLATPKPAVGMGTLLFSLIEDRDRGDDLVFELHDRPTPPDFE